MESRIMRYCGNTLDPRDPHNLFMLAHGMKESLADAIKHHRMWLSDKMIGDPQPGEGEFTIDRLKSMGYVGVYTTEMDEYGRQNPGQCVREYSGWLMRHNPSTNRWESV